MIFNGFLLFKDKDWTEILSMAGRAVYLAIFTFLATGAPSISLSCSDASHSLLPHLSCL